MRTLLVPLVAVLGTAATRLHAAPPPTMTPSTLITAPEPAPNTATPPVGSKAPGRQAAPRHPVAPAVAATARIDSIAEEGRLLTISDTAGRTTHVRVRIAELQALLRDLRPGDIVRLSTTTDEGDVFLSAIAGHTPAVPRFRRVLALLVPSLLLLGLLRLSYGQRLRALVIGADNRYSKSQFQMAVWFATLIVTYSAAVLLRVWESEGLLWGGVDIPNNLLLLSGLSALSFAGAKGITTSRLERRAVAKTPQEGPARISDLLYDDDNRPDLGDMQMLVMTGLATVVYLGSVLTYLGHLQLSATTLLPDVDTTILSAFGLGQGAYLAKKALEGGAPTTPAAGAPPTPTSTLPTASPTPPASPEAKTP